MTTDKFAINFKRIMELRGLNQVELSKKSGIMQPLISSYLNENKRAKFPSLKNIVKLADALNCSIDELLGISLPDLIDLNKELPEEIPEDILKIVADYKKLSPDKQKEFFNFVMTYFKAYLNKS